MRAGTIASALLLGTILSAPAFGQDRPQNTASDDSDIIVTARRSEERLQDVPISITVLSEEAIAKRNIYNANDLASYVPSLSLNSNFGPEKASFAIRGFVQEGKTAPSVGVYFADVVAPRANGGTTSGNGAGVGSMMDLQNVQVLKGPQGTLFGRNTTGGAILLVPAKPTNNLEGYVEGSIGDYDLRRVQAVLNAPLSETFRVRAAVDWNKRDGYLHNKSGIGPDRLGDTNYIATRLSIVGDLTPDIENYTIFSYSRSNNHGVAPKMIGCNNNFNPATDSPLVAVLGPLSCAQIARQNARGDGFWDVESADPNQLERVEQWQVINTTTWRASDNLTIKNIASYAEYREKADFSLWGDNLLVPGAGGLRLPTITIGLGASGYNSSQSTFTEELQFQGSALGDALKWQAGAYLEISKPLGFSSSFAHIFLSCTNALTYQCSDPLGFGSISSTNYKDTFNNKGLYAQATYKLSDRFSVTGGIRYTMDKLTDINRNLNIYLVAPGTQLFTCQNIIKFNNGAGGPLVVEGPQSARCENVFQTKSNRPTWLIDLDYKPADDMLLYAKWARGYRQGGINPNNLGIETWGPEKVDTYEVGAKTSFRGAVPGYFNIAAFYNNFRGQQLAVNSVVAPAYVNSVPPIQAIVNAGKSRLWGVEVDASVRPFEGLRLDVSYAYLNTKLQEFTPPTPPVYYSSLLPTAQVGEPLSLSPKNRVTLTGTYTLPLDQSVGEVSFGATFTHTDANAAVSQIFSPFLYKVKASNLLNLNVDWKSAMGGPIDLAFFMTNVTNEKLITFPSGSWQTFGADVGHTNMPRMFGFRARVNFGK
ncbi:MAG TPA: TonB-dependent receptor [Novosphingobium sp.]